MGDPTTYVFQFIYNENDSVDTKSIQYFIMNGLGLCIKVESHVVHILYAWSFSQNIAVPISMKKHTFFFSLNSSTTVFAWEAGNSNINRSQQLGTLI